MTFNPNTWRDGDRISQWKATSTTHATRCAVELLKRSARFVCIPEPEDAFRFEFLAGEGHVGALSELPERDAGGPDAWYYVSVRDGWEIRDQANGLLVAILTDSKHEREADAKRIACSTISAQELEDERAGQGRWDRSGCARGPCTCHDETIRVPYVCSGCGCRPADDNEC